MFSKDDYKQYFDEVEGKLSDLLTIYTDLLNDIDNKSVRSKISAITQESLETFRFVKQQKEILLKENN